MLKTAKILHHTLPLDTYVGTVVLTFGQVTRFDDIGQC